MHLFAAPCKTSFQLLRDLLMPRRLLLLLPVLCLAPLAAWSQNLIANGTYTITSKSDGNVVDVYNNSLAQGGLIDHYASNGGNNQKWTLTNLGSNYVELVNVNSGLAMEVVGNSLATGQANIDQWGYNGGNNQKWHVVSEGGGYYELVNENSGYALDLTSGSSYLDQWPSSGTANQLWSFSSTSGGGGGGGSSKYIPVRGSYGFIKGANLAWLDGAYSTYLGVDPHHVDYGTSWNSNSMNAHLADMHNMGINVVRLWLFQDDQGCTLDGSGNVTGVTSQFWSNLDTTVQLAANNGISLYLTLNNGRADFQQNSTMLNAFINKALVPMINRYKGNNAIFAIDTMNEIDGTVAGSTGNYTNTGSTWSQAQNYMRTVTSAIHNADSSRLVSTSSGWHSWTNLSEFKGLGLDFYDFHVYADNGYVPSVASLGMDKPIYVGESGQGSSYVSDSIQNTAENNFLYNSDSGGYAGLGIWDYGYAGDPDVFHMLQSNGSWRPVCSTIQNFKPY